MDKFAKVNLKKGIQDAEAKQAGTGEDENPDAWRDERTSITITKGLLWDLKHEAFNKRLSMAEYIRHIFDNRHKIV